MGNPAALLYRDAALADGRSPELRLGVSVLVRGGRIDWIRATESEPTIDDGTKIIDASGATVVPGMVDAHSHITLPGGSHWIERGRDPPSRLLEVAEHNGELLRRSGVRWARDVGSPTGRDPKDGRERALALGVRDRWRSRVDRPYLRAAGTWIERGSLLPAGLAVSVNDGDALEAAARRQLDDGADMVKLMMDGAGNEESPWSASDVRRVTDLAHARGAIVTAHTTFAPGAHAAVDGGVDSLEHGFGLDSEAARKMAERGTFLVSTLAVFRSWATFARTSPSAPVGSEPAQSRISTRRARALESTRLAHAAGVRIAAGTDFGGGSLRAGQLAWEVEALVEAGLEPWEALGAATHRGGELLREPDAGTIREGGPADFFLVHGDPLTEPAALWRVWRVAWEPEPVDAPR
jgi:imidazolonepropionase-like amidohydrolase